MEAVCHTGWHAMAGCPTVTQTTQRWVCTDSVVLGAASTLPPRATIAALIAVGPAVARVPLTLPLAPAAAAPADASTLPPGPAAALETIVPAGAGVPLALPLTAATAILVAAATVEP